MLVMVSGPCTTGAKTEAEAAANLLKLQIAAREVYLKGHMPLIAIINAKAILEAEGKTFWARDELMQICLGYVDKCDCCYRTEGASEGADLEVKEFIKQGKSVYFSIDEIPQAARQNKSCRTGLDCA